MTRTEVYVIGFIGAIGFIAAWVWTGSQAAGWTLLALGGIIGECADAIVRRLNKVVYESREKA